tara:strand:- start:4181 stop:4846 length:666 start_codon:yes stop_codon:yes gene_type:complete
MDNLTLLIPANKEKESLPIFLKELENFKCHKMIVLQKEDSETLDSISKFENIKIFFQKNNGYGNALIEGLDEITTEYFCIINADGSMDPKFLKDMLSHCLDADLVFGSRYITGGGSDDDDLVTFTGNKIFTFLGNILFSLNLSDILYTYVLGKTNSIKKLSLKNKDFRICVEIPVKAKKHNLKYKTLPSMERKRIGGKKKVSAIKDGFLILIAVIGLFLKK